jgi:hypothetical protein
MSQSLFNDYSPGGSSVDQQAVEDIQQNDAIQDNRIQNVETSLASSTTTNTQQTQQINVLETKSQNIVESKTDATKTTFNNTLITPEVDCVNYKLTGDPGTIFKQKNDTLYAGTNSGNNITTHANGVLIGLLAGEKIETGNDNVCIGANSGRDVVNGSQNILIGAGSGLQKSGNLASNNIAIGINSQRGQTGITTGFNNISMGSESLRNMTSCINNICIGSDSGNGIASGSNNTLIGVASTTLANPSNCTTLGYNTNVSAFTNSTAIGFGAQVDNNDQVSLGNNSATQIINTGNGTCDLGSTTHKFKDLHLSGNSNSTNSIASGYVQSPIVSATNTITTDKISNQDAFPTLCIELTPTTGVIKLHKDAIPSAGNINLGSLTDKFFNGYFGGTISSLISDANVMRTLGISNKNNILALSFDNTTADITLHKNILPDTGNTLNIGANTASGRLNEVNAQILLANQEVRSNKHYNENGTAGIDIGNTSTGAVNLTGNKYQNHNNSIVTLNGSGQIQQPSDNAKVDGNGNITCKNLELLNIASSGEIKAKTLQSNDIANPLSLLNRATIAGKGIVIDNTTNANIQLTGDSYIGTANAMMRLNTNGTLEKTNINIDGAGLNNISNCNTLTSTSIASSNILNSSNLFSPNLFLGTLGGGSASAGTMDINSGNIINTGDIRPITDNTEDIGSLALSYKDIHIKGDVYKNGVIYGGGGGGGVNGISSVDNGGGDIEISFTGTDYKTNGYLTVDTNGKIQVTPSIVVSNAEFDNIVTKWNFERSNNNLTISKIYLPVGVPVGSFNHTIHNIYLALQDAVNNTKIIYDVKFVNYNGSTQISETTVSNITNAVEIYNSGSTAHPNNVANANLKAHISNHFTSDYGLANFPGFTVTTTPRVAVPSALVSSWSHTDPFAITFGVNGNAPFSSFYIGTLYGSQNGFTNASTGSSGVPAGYTEIF